MPWKKINLRKLKLLGNVPQSPSLCLFFIRYLSVGVPICIYNFIKAITLFKAAHRIRKKEKEELEFKRRNYHYSRQISIPRPDYNCQDQHHQKMDQFVNQQQYIYPHYQTMNTANLAIHPYHQNTMQYTQPTLYSVSVPQSAEFYWNKSHIKLQYFNFLIFCWFATKIN